MSFICRFFFAAGYIKVCMTLNQSFTSQMSKTLYFSLIPRWRQPRELNGILEHYRLYTLNPIHTPTVWNIVHNSTKNLQAHMFWHLSPGCLYLIKLGVSQLSFCHFSSSHIPSFPNQTMKYQKASFFSIYTKNSLHNLKMKSFC